MTPTLSFRGGRLPDLMPVVLDRLIESKLLVQANSGGGKSWAVRYLLEQTHGKVQHIVLDREGEFATLRERFPYLLVGRDGDVAADVRSAKLLARKLLELGLSAVIDLSEMSLGGQKEYMRVFVEAINHLPRQLWKDCLIVIDEAHLFAPEKGKGTSVASEAIALLLSTGRKRGYCVVLATQRIAKLDKDVSAECLNKMIGRTSEEDLQRAGDELGMDKASRKALRSLEPGTFWTYGPAITPDPVIVRTGDVTTQPPKRGTAREPAPVAPATIKRVLAELSDLPKQAADEERTLVDLQRELREAKGALARAEKGGVQKNVEKPVADPRAIERAVKDATRAKDVTITGLRRALEAAMKFVISVSTHNFDVAGVDKAELERAITAAVGKATQIIDQRLDARAKQVDQIRLQAQRIAASLKTILGNEEQEVAIAVEVTKNPPFTVTPAKRSEASPRPVRDRAPSGDSSLGKGERIILTAIAQYPDGADREQLSVLTGYKRSSRDTYIQRLQANGFIEVGSDAIRATDSGVSALGDFEPLPTGEALQAYWLDRLGGGERAILEVLIRAYPDAVARDTISDRTEYKRSSRDTYLQRLGARKLIELGGIRGEVKASDTLFNG